MIDPIKGTLLLRPTQVVITWPDGRKQVVPMVSETLRIGRGNENNEIAVPLEFKSISRRHIEIRREGDIYRLTDLGSANGVYINGQKIYSVLLKDADEIRIGDINDKQELIIMFQKGTEALATIGASEQETFPPISSLSFVVPENVPYLSLKFSNGQVSYFPIQKNNTIVGRSVEANLSIPFRFISSKHFELRQRGNHFMVMDLNSTNGTLLNNKPLVPNEAVPIPHSAIIRIGDDSLGNSIGLTFFNPFEQQAPQDGFVMASPTMMVEQSKSVTIGRAFEADIRLDAPNVSRRHASLRRVSEQYILEDLGSANGTLVNDQRIQSVELQDGDLIQIGNFLLVFANGQITPYQSNGMRLDVANLSKDVRSRRGKVRILDNVSLSILPREFVAIVGGSGAGKSTLLNALVGIRPGVGSGKSNSTDMIFIASTSTFAHSWDTCRRMTFYIPRSPLKRHWIMPCA